MNSQSFVEELENSLAYAQASYADVTINAASSATEYISPAAGNYNKNYKITDSIDLSFTPKSSYQFVKWIATPEDSVSFEDAAQTKTKAIILKADSPITIEPEVYARPQITVSPSNTLENPRNSAIVISFSESMNLTDEKLADIAITIDDVSILENFEAPVVDEDNTRVTYIPKRDNLIEVTSGVKVVKITIPESFYYEKNETKVYLSEEFKYSYKINSKTETTAEITVSCSSLEGDLSYSGTKVYYLDNSFSVNCTPKDGYSLAGWIAKYADGTEVENSVLQTTVSEDLKTIDVKVLTGTDKSITVEPVLVERGVLVVNFKAEHGSTIPLETRKYYLGDTFTVNYKEENDYCFTGWKVTEVSNRNTSEILQITNTDKMETECKVLKTDTSIVIEAESLLRPKVLAMTPIYDNAGVFRDSNIKIIFSQEMSLNSIYWTKAEMDEMNIPESNRLKAGSYKDKDGNSYYHGYLEQGTADTTIFKNITIKSRTDNKNLLNCFGAPYYSSSDNTILIIPSKTDVYTDPGIDVQVALSKEFADSKSIPLVGSYTGCYFTNATVDTQKPTLEITKIVMNTSGKIYDPEAIASLPTEISYVEFDNVVDTLWTTEYWDGALKTKTLSLSLYGNVVDGGSKPDRIEVVMEPVATWATKTDNEALRITTSVSTPIAQIGGDKCDFSTTPLKFEMKLANYKMIEGGYRIKIHAYDNRNNCATFEHQIPFKYDDDLTPSVNKNIDIGGNQLTTDETLQNCTITVNNHDNCKFSAAFPSIPHPVVTFANLPFISTRESFNPFGLYPALLNYSPIAATEKTPETPLAYWLRVRDIWNNYTTVQYLLLRNGKCAEIIQGNANYEGVLLELRVKTNTYKAKKVYVKLSSDEITDFSVYNPTLSVKEGVSENFSATRTFTPNRNTWCYEMSESANLVSGSINIQIYCSALKNKSYTAYVCVEDEQGYKSAWREIKVN